MRDTYTPQDINPPADGCEPERCRACGALAQPNTIYCLECDIELAGSFDEAREARELADEMAEPTPYRCADVAQRELEF